MIFVAKSALITSKEFFIVYLTITASMTHDKPSLNFFKN